MSKKTIGLYGDSFVEVWDKDKKKNKDKNYLSLKTWPNLIAEKFDLDIVHSGQGGTSYWDIPLQQFSLNDIPDILIFCWTSSARLYNKEAIQLHPDPSKSWFNKEVSSNIKEQLINASQQYFKYLHDEKKEILEYQSCLFHFDETILSKIPSDRKIIHLWSFGHNTTNYHPNNIAYLHNWKHGLEIRPCCMSIALMDGCSIDDADPFENHLNTQGKHNLIVDFISHSLVTYDTNTLNDYSDNVMKKITS